MLWVSRRRATSSFIAATAELAHELELLLMPLHMRWPPPDPAHTRTSFTHQHIQLRLSTLVSACSSSAYCSSSPMRLRYEV